MLSQARAKELFTYDPVAGILYHREKKHCAEGQVAGFGGGPYLRVYADGGTYYVHQIAWVIMTGVWPERVDHRNRDKRDNTWVNLREATPGQNNANCGPRKRNKFGLRGVFRSRNKFGAKICVGGKQTRLGTFDTPEEAHAKWCEVAKEVWGEFFGT